MLELGSIRKNKINLADYNFEQDIQYRMLIADFSSVEHQILQEIFFSPLKFPLKKLMRDLDCEEKEIHEVLEKLSKARLLFVQNDIVTVDKEVRKYFEFHMKRFEPEFKPDMEFLQGILRKVPIHLLTSWYAIPRTSNNIFDSIIEKYLLTPHIFQRYLEDLSFTDPKIRSIIQDLFQTDDFKISSNDLIIKYNLDRYAFEEIMLLLEFHFVACLTYVRNEEHDSWEEFVTPFYEWHQYLLFLRDTKCLPIPSSKKIIRKRENDFAFVEDLSKILTLAKKEPLFLNDLPSLSKQLTPLLQLESNSESYCKQCIEKILLIQLVRLEENRLILTNTSTEWLNMNSQNQALYLYRHPLNQFLDTEGNSIRYPNNAFFTKDIEIDRKTREAEKSIKRVVHGDWVFFDEFIKGVTVAFNESQEIKLRRVGHWKYTIPHFEKEDEAFIQKIVLQWLFELGIVVPGICEERACFCVTSFGRFLFEE